MANPSDAWDPFARDEPHTRALPCAGARVRGLRRRRGSRSRSGRSSSRHSTCSRRRRRTARAGGPQPLEPPPGLLHLPARPADPGRRLEPAADARRARQARADRGRPPRRRRGSLRRRRRQDARRRFPRSCGRGCARSPQARWPWPRSATATISTPARIPIARHRDRRLRPRRSASVVTGRRSSRSWTTCSGTTRRSATAAAPTRQCRPRRGRSFLERRVIVRLAAHRLRRRPRAAATAMGKANRGRDTAPELRLRSALHRRGLRFRVNRRVAADLRTTVDIVFGRARVAVFVDGCFWHRCPEHSTMPKANREWWAAKLEENVARTDARTSRSRERGWTVVRVWEHDDPEDAANRVAAIVQAARRWVGRRSDQQRPDDLGRPRGRGSADPQPGSHDA